MISFSRLTNFKIERIARERSPGKYADGGGLWLQVSPGGSVSWLFRSVAGGRDRVLGLGPLHAVPAKTARAKAQALRTRIGEGGDPWNERRPTMLSPTFEKCLKDFLALPTNAKRAEWRSELLAHLTPLNKLPVDQITFPLVRDTLAPHWTLQHRKVAGRVRARLETILDYAANCGYRSGDNPATMRKLKAAGFDPVSEAPTQHHTGLHFDAVPSFYAKLAKRSDICSRALQFLILCGVRSADILGVKGNAEKPPISWAHIDLERAVWSIAKTKTGAAHAVLLSDQAVDLLRSIKAQGLNETLVFPGSRRGGTFGVNAMNDVIKEINIGAEFTAHGFRSSFRQWIDSAGHDRRTAEEVLAHKNVGSLVELSYRNAKLVNIDGKKVDSIEGKMVARRRAVMQSWGAHVACNLANRAQRAA